jgi:hypothetical protein
MKLVQESKLEQKKRKTIEQRQQDDEKRRWRHLELLTRLETG